MGHHSGVPLKPFPTWRAAAPRTAAKARLGAVLCAFALLCPAAPAPAQAENNLPALGDPEAEGFSVGTERKLGDQIMREIRADPDYLDDPVLLEYLQSIWQPLVAEARARGNIAADIDPRFSWEPFLVRDPTVNAFALPGGYIGVQLGLIAMTSTRDELAAVLAHELSHISQRHIARSIANSKRQSLLGLAAMVLGLLAASRSRSPDAANAVIVGSQAATIQGQLNFSRDVEREADRVGFAVMTGAGFAPGGMAAMFEKLDKGSRLNDSGGFPYLRTHPLTTERIGEARARMGTSPPAPPVSVLEHTLAEARARVLMDPRHDALRRWQALDADRVSTARADKLLSAYSSALASSLLRDWERADASIANALALVRGAPTPSPRAERAVLLMQADSLLARGAAERAAQVLQRYAADGSRPMLLALVQVALAPATNADEKTFAARAADLQTWVAVNPNDAMAWSALGQVWGRLGRPLRSLRADAESRAATGDLLGAVDRLRAGERLARAGGPVDFIDVSVIDARLRDIEAQRRAIAADEKTLR
ncbi:MAG TPA: M48 family metalloprotease [Caldimonas sp.]